MFRFVEKIWWKHHVTTEEVEEMMAAALKVRLIEKGRVAGEHV